MNTGRRAHCATTRPGGRAASALLLVITTAAMTPTPAASAILVPPSKPPPLASHHPPVDLPLPNQFASRTKPLVALSNHHRRRRRRRRVTEHSAAALPVAVALVRGGQAATLSPQLQQVQQQRQQQQQRNARRGADVRTAPTAGPIGNSSQGKMAAASRSVPLARRTRILWAALAVALLLVAVRERAVWVPLLSDKDVIQRHALEALNSLRPPPGAGPAAALRSLALYAAGMAGWELAGLSTIPVETAAGMVFGFRQAALASLVGKVTGATLAFGLGRTVLAGHIASHPAFANNAVFQLLTASNGRIVTQPRHPPLATAFFMKFSCFPELIKNLGSSVLPVIRPWMFVLVTLVHGGAFTLVWTGLGVETAARMQDAAMTANRPLQAALMAAMITGFCLTPLAMAWWIRDLKRGATQVAKRQSRFRRAYAPRKPSLPISRPTDRLPAATRRLSPGAAPAPMTPVAKSWATRAKERMQQLSLAEVWIVGILCTYLLGGGGSDEPL